MAKFDFSHSKLRKQPFCGNFQHPGGPRLLPIEEVLTTVLTSTITSFSAIQCFFHVFTV